MTRKVIKAGNKIMTADKIARIVKSAQPGDRVYLRIMINEQFRDTSATIDRVGNDTDTNNPYIVVSGAFGTRTIDLAMYGHHLYSFIPQETATY